jgi:hypothetical protein
MGAGGDQHSETRDQRSRASINRISENLRQWVKQQVWEKAIELNQQTCRKRQQSHQAHRSQRKKFKHEAFSKKG